MTTFFQWYNCQSWDSPSEEITTVLWNYFYNERVTQTVMRDYIEVFSDYNLILSEGR